MAYTLTYSGNQTGGNRQITVPDGSVYIIGNVLMPGRNFNGYGSPVDQNILSMIENFASSSTGPANPVTGQMWYNANAATLKFNVSTTNISSWVSVVKSDDSDNGNVTLTGNLIIGANSAIYGNGRGIHSINASNLSTGTVPNSRMSGTYNINVNGNIGGSDAVSVTVSGNVSGANVVTGSLTVNQSANLGNVGNVRITGGANGQYLQTNGSGGLVWATLATSTVNNGASNVSIPTPGGNVNTSVGGVTDVLVVTATGANVAGTVQSTGNISTGGTVIAAGNITTGANVIATGNVVGGNVVTSGAVVTPTLSAGAPATAGTITGAWTLSPGSTMEATYADLAERHHSDAVYTVGTVMTVGGINEVTAATTGSKILGVVSNAYAYLMNSTVGDDTTHPPVAYVGRVPVRVVGPIAKHDVIQSTTGGVASVSVDGQGFGWALETNSEPGEKLVLCIIK